MVTVIDQQDQDLLDAIDSQLFRGAQDLNLMKAMSTRIFQHIEHFNDKVEVRNLLSSIESIDDELHEKFEKKWITGLSF